MAHFGHRVDQVLAQGQKAPHGPGKVQTGHGRVLVGECFGGPFGERPQPSQFVNGVDIPGFGQIAAVAATDRQQAGRHQREQREPHQSRPGGQQPGGAPEGVVPGEAPVEPDEGEGGDREVEEPVEQVPELDERHPADKQVLEVALEVQPDAALPVDHQLGVGLRLARFHCRGAELVPHPGVDAVEGPDDGQFQIPAGPGAVAGTEALPQRGQRHSWMLVSDHAGSVRLAASGARRTPALAARPGCRPQ